MLTDLENQLQTWTKIETMYWKEYSRDKFLHEQDRCTKYFHMLASNRKRYNHIFTLREDSGLWIQGKDQLDKLLKDHFVHICTTYVPIINHVFDDIIHSVLDDFDNEQRTSMPSCEEIRTVLFDMNPWGSPGPDGYPPGFFQTHWEMVNQPVIDLVHKFFDTGKLPDKINESFISLIPKTDNHVSPVDFRPISLSNNLYKLCSKILATRLKSVLDKIISPCQSAFIPKRHIVDNIIIAHEVLHSMRTNKTKNGYLALKLDLSKAFDKMEWSFVIFMFRKLGFSEKWCDLVYECISTVQSTVLLNGVPGIPFHPSRGLRQGYPLSPYFFITALEGLSRLFFSC